MKEASNVIDISFQDRTQVLICGSTLFACQMALESARAGLKTVLAMERLHPFYEAIHCLNPWVPRERADIELVKKTLDDGQLTSVSGDRLYFNMTEAAIEIEDRLCDAGVNIYYNAPVAGSLWHDANLGGVVFGGKPGLFAVESSLIVDATPDATVARTLGLPLEEVASEDGLEQVHYSVERCRKRPYDEDREHYRASNGVDVRLENRDFYTHFSMTYPARPQHPLSHAEEFRDVYAAALEYTPNLPSRQFRGADAYLRRGCDRVEATNGIIASVPNLRLFSPMAVSSNTAGQLSLLEHEFLFNAFPKALREEAFAGVPCKSESRPRPCYRLLCGSVNESEGKMEHSFADPRADFPGMERAKVSFTPPEPSLSKSLGIIGAGTSGIAATIQAVDLGIDTVCIDAAAEPGGTVTVGGVTNLWYGNRTRGFLEYYRDAGAENDGLNAPPFFRRIAGSEQLDLLPLTQVCGVAVEDDALRAVYVVTPLGLAAIGMNHVIDATGDASLAAWAGCEYHFGSERDELSLWASLGSFGRGQPEGRRQFLTPLDERSPDDTRRVVQAMRRFANRQPSPAFLLCPRESRHIHADKRVTMLDAMAGRRFADGIVRFSSNLDLKGNSSSDMSHVGLLSRTRWRNHEVTLPYAALIPDRLANLLVVGKAYAATSDAMSLARMQRDLAMMGRAAAYAMCQCVRDGLDTRSVSIEKLQAILVEAGIMEESDRADDDLGISDDESELLDQILASDDPEESLEPTAQLVLLNRARSTSAREGFDPSGLSAMRYLCIEKDERGQEACRERLEEWIKTLANGIPDQDRMPEKMGHLLPDHAFAPEPLYWLMMLALAGDDTVIPACRTIAGAVAPDDTITFNTLWVYVFAVAYSCERLAGPEAIPPLAILLESSHLQVSVLQRGPDLRGSLDTITERRSYLRLCMLRSLARSGSMRGYLGLTDYLQSAHACFARHARSELCTLTGRDFLFDCSKWREFLDKRCESLDAQPYTGSLE